MKLKDREIEKSSKDVPYSHKKINKARPAKQKVGSFMKVYFFNIHKGIPVHWKRFFKIIKQNK
jgi:hypothetical protein